MKAAAMLLSLSLCFGLFSCSHEGEGDNGIILARINNYALPLAEFESKLAAELELDRDYKQTPQAKRDFLDDLIKKELLIQEAKKLELDRKEDFVRAMERYWESTLIKDLLTVKSRQINSQIQVSDHEVKVRYEDLTKSSARLPPMVEIQESLRKEIKREKKADTLKQWITDLRSNSKILINEELLQPDRMEQAEQ